MSNGKSIMFAFLLAAATLSSGCATYVRDRVADAGDIFTATVGTGIGVTAKAGPIHTGLGSVIDFYGLRGGEFGSFVPDSKLDDRAPNRITDTLLPPSGDEAVIVAAFGTFGPYKSRAWARGKTFSSPYLETGELFPFLDLPWDNDAECHPLIDPQWTQIDLSVGLIASVRLGFNPGELLDFLIGLVGFDLYGDDLAGADADWKVLAEKRRDEARSRKRSTRKRRLRFDEWSAVGVPASRDWTGWRPDMDEVSRAIPDASFQQGINEEGWRILFPVPDHPYWTNVCHVVLHVHVSPAQARLDLFNAVDFAMTNYGKTKRESDEFPGEICFTADGVRHLLFARECIFVSIADYSMGRENHALKLARALDAQILEALR